MKKLLLVSTMFALTAASMQAQGFINFGNTSTTLVSTNITVGGTLAVPTMSLLYRYALFCSTTETNVNGQTAAIVGGASLKYAFNDSNWTLVAYGTNSISHGIIASAIADASGRTAVSGVAGGSSAHFVVIGWSANAGANIAALQSWFNGGNPVFNGWIGQSAVSGAITVGTSSATTLFGASSPDIGGFTLGLVTPPAAVAPVITAQPADQTASSGTSVTFSVNAYGTPAPAFQWVFNGTHVISGATGSYYTINNAQSTNAGTYSVVISNSAGSTNSAAATLTVNPGPGYITFANAGTSITRIYTNSAVGGSATGLTVGGGNLYYYALYASATATSVLGQTSPILGAASDNYAFNDANWSLVGYATSGTNVLSHGMLSAIATSPSVYVPGISAGSAARFVVVGWSVNVGTTIAGVEGWFNSGSPASDGWIGQSAVSGAITLGPGGIYPTPLLFATNAPQLQGFTLGLASPAPHAAYTVPPAPPAVVQTAMSGNVMQLSWPTASGSWGVQSATSPAGPWADTGLFISTDGVNSYASVTNATPGQYYRLVAN